MLFRKLLIVFSVVLTSLMTSCTTRYQDMLRERDERIRELSGDVARLRGENDDLQRRGAAAPQQPTEASARQNQEPNLAEDIKKEIGEGVDVWSKGGRIRIGVEDSVTFDSGSTALKDSASKVIRNIANVLNSKFSGRRFYVEGHTDNDPIQKTKDKFRDNRHLSSERADSVARALARQGVPDSAIVVVGDGQYEPRDGKAKARNRRVEIVVGEPVNQ